MNNNSETLFEVLQIEMNRVRDKVLPLYDSIPTGVTASISIRQALDLASKAIIENDVVEMIRINQKLKEYKE